MNERWRWVGIGFLAWAMYVNQGNGWVVQQRFETEADCAAVAKDYALDALRPPGIACSPP